MVENYADAHCLLEIQTGNHSRAERNASGEIKKSAECDSKYHQFQYRFDILHLERSFDLGLVAVYPDRAALDFYTEHAVHQEAARMGKEIAERVVSVDFINEQ